MRCLEEVRRDRACLCLRCRRDARLQNRELQRRQAQRVERMHASGRRNDERLGKRCAVCDHEARTSDRNDHARDRALAQRDQSEVGPKIPLNYKR
jgi:hypothetical protein